MVGRGVSMVLRRVGCVLLLGVIGVAVVVSSAAEGPIRIGVSEPLTGSVSLAGASTLNGITLAVEEINLAGGLLGRQVQLYVCDSKCDATEAVTCAQRLIYDARVVTVIGYQCSGASLAVMQLHQEAGIPLHVDCSTSISITLTAGVGGNDWVFRCNPPDPIKTVAYSQYMMAHSVPNAKVAILAVTGSWGEGAVKTFATDIPAAGGQIVSVDYFTEGESEFTPVLTKIKNENPDALLVLVRAQTAITFLKQYLELNMTVPLFSMGELVAQAVISAVGVENAEGITSCAGWLPGDPADEPFVTAYRARWGSEPSEGSAEGYVAMTNIAQAIRDQGAATPDAIRQGLKALNTDSLMGHVTFDDHNQAWTEVVIGVNSAAGKVELLDKQQAVRPDGFWASMATLFGSK